MAASLNISDDTSKSRTFLLWLIFMLDLNLILWCLTPISTIYFSYIMAVSFIGGGNRNTKRKPLTCHKSLTNFITWCCIEYTSPWAKFELTTLVMTGTDCTGCCKSNYHTIMPKMGPIWLGIFKLLLESYLWQPPGISTQHSVQYHPVFFSFFNHVLQTLPSQLLQSPW